MVAPAPPRVSKRGDRRGKVGRRLPSGVGTAALDAFWGKLTAELKGGEAGCGMRTRAVVWRRVGTREVPFLPRPLVHPSPSRTSTTSTSTSVRVFPAIAVSSAAASASAMFGGEKVACRTERERAQGRLRTLMLARAFTAFGSFRVFSGVCEERREVYGV
jgi:hypothetical protein